MTAMLILECGTFVTIFGALAGGFVSVSMLASVIADAEKDVFRLRETAKGLQKHLLEKVTSLDPGTGSTVRAAWFPT